MCSNLFLEEMKGIVIPILPGVFLNVYMKTPAAKVTMATSKATLILPFMGSDKWFFYI
jgi:hypothetical protein